jgi:TRAP-type C4-dicarboxylate transport system substrate-binding protein
MKFPPFLRAAAALPLLAGILLAAPGGADAAPVRIKLATMAPDGSTWHELLKDLQADWARVSNGQVELRIFAGGVAGDEPVVMKKMGIDNYHAALISSHGLSTISKSTRIFTIPRMLRSNEELDRAMEMLAPELEAKLAEKGYVVLAWADAGWVRFFVPTADASVNGVRKHKLFVWAGDSEGLELWRQAGFNAVPLPGPELLTGLKTNLVNAFDTMPSYALASQAFRHTPYMIDMRWAPLPGALIMTQKTWDKIPQELRPALKTEAAKFAQRFRTETRKLDDQAVEAMKARGLKIVTPTPEQMGEWDREVEKAYPKFRGFYVSAEDFDRFGATVKQIRAGGR